ncbi:NB-ARC domain-containing protein [Corchorus olitorius]|uniref:NB-ARC domain-containing protein n=1 Tax=Corchorus olitorius TaxID=93759 RepID=A0A1R3L4X8_9ROSI|nr:NB-ARC domain-containing protein [Corchorus olitorius]
MTENELMRTLRDVLKDKRYLVVLDDIWSSDQWDILKHAFPPGKNGSKILFTTRIKDVPLLADPSSYHFLQMVPVGSFSKVKHFKQMEQSHIMLAPENLRN